MRSAILAPERSVRAFDEGVALSPDGRTLAFVSVDDEGRQSLWIRDLEALDPRRFEGTEGAQNPFWSPDGTEIAFFSQRKLKRIPAAGGPVRTVCTASVRTTPRGTWNRDGVILFTSAELGPILRVHEDGGTPAPLTAVDAERGETHLWPSFLPDGGHFLFKSFAMAAGRAAIYVTSLDRPSDHRLVMTAEPSVPGAFYVEPGFVVYSREWALFAQSIDPGSFATRGRAVPIAPLVAAPGGSLLASASDEGTPVGGARVEPTGPDRAGVSPSLASLLISEGVSPADVQQALGHASIELIVNTYLLREGGGDDGASGRDRTRYGSSGASSDGDG